jgi:ATP-binding cassette subfamily A (ABC1) protein 3
MAQIRQKVGVCLQTDVLYERLTVREHLEFFARLKGLTGETLEDKVEEIVKKCCLET